MSELTEPNTAEHGAPSAPAAGERAKGDGGSEGTVREGAVSTGAPSKGSQPGRSVSRLTHGLYGQSYQLVLGKLPKSLGRVEDDAYAFRSAVEQAVVDAHGSISLTNACLIATAARWERHGLLALRWLRERHDALDDAQRLTYSREIARASAERDKAIAALKLERDATSEIDAFYARLRAGAIETPSAEEDAPESDADAENGNGGQHA